MLYANPLSLPVWTVGLVSLLVLGEWEKIKFLGLVYLILVVVLIASQSCRPDRIAAMYTVLFASGSVVIERVSSTGVKRLLLAAVPFTLIIAMAFAAPIASPLLSPPALKNYLSWLELSFAIVRSEDVIPQWIADRLGWEELAAEVGRVYHALSPNEQRNTVILSGHYGEAGALEFYGRSLVFRRCTPRTTAITSGVLLPIPPGRTSACWSRGVISNGCSRAWRRRPFGLVNTARNRSNGFRSTSPADRAFRSRPCGLD